MIDLPVLFALQAGMITTVSPCAFPMLPAYIGYHLGVYDEGFSETPAPTRAFRALILGFIATFGFMIVSGSTGLAIALGGRLFIRDVLPQVATALGGGLLVMGFVLLVRGKAFSLPLHMSGSQRRGHLAVLLFGMAYGIAAVGCTLPLFLLVIVNALTAAGPAGAVFQFGVYAAGMGTVLIAVTVSAAIFRGVVATGLRRALPYIEWLTTMLAIQAGAYLVVYWRTEGGFRGLDFISTWGAALLVATIAVSLTRHLIVFRRSSPGEAMA